MPPAALTEASVLEALKVCFDPELAVNIVDLGLVHAVTVSGDPDAPGFEPRYRVHVALLTRHAHEDRQAMLVGQVENRLRGMREISHVEVQIFEQAVWTQDRMSDTARRQLGLDRPSRQGLVTIKI